MPIGLLYGLSAATVWGLTDVCAALAGRRIGSLRTVAGMQLTSLIVLLALALLTRSELPIEPSIVPAAAALGALSSIAYLSFFSALRFGPITVVSPVVSAYGGLTVILAVILLGEALTRLQALGTATGTAGVLLVGLTFDGHWRRARFVGPGVPLAIVALVTWAFVTIGYAAAIEQAGWLPVIVVARVANTITVWILLAGWLLVERRRRAARPAGATADPGDAAGAPDDPAPDPRDLRTRALALVVLGGVLDIAGYVAFAIGLERSFAWLVGLASSFGPAVAVLVAVTVLGERLRPVQWLGLAGIAVGLVLVGLP